MKFFASLSLAASLFLAQSASSFAQNDSLLVRKYMKELTKPSMKGRGYVAGGMQRAATYIADEMAYYDLVPLGNRGYYHDFEMPVNVFPSAMTVYFNDESMIAGTDYLVDPFSQSVAYTDKKLLFVDMEAMFKGANPDEFTSIWNKFYVDHGKDAYYVYVLENTAAFKAMWGNKSLRAMSQFLIEGNYIIPTLGTPLWYPAMNQEKFNIIYVFGDAIEKLKRSQYASVKVNATLVNDFKASNVAGYVPAKKATDEFIVFTAHYDHIGMMGSKTRFDGANDNASGTAVLLTLMQHYRQFPLENYNVLFVACAAEEAGLIGSFRYAEAGLVDLSKIKFLVNMDMWGDAQNGVAVINGTKFEKEFEWMQAANRTVGQSAEGFFKEIRKGGEAVNSDHAPFYLKGVPCFFLFTMGGPGHYHHVKDTHQSLKLTHINQAIDMVKIFINRF